jgi:beta-phosphoglucomutase-like phosphatase (HAD superfamily)
MSGVIVNYSKFVVRALVRFLQAEGVSLSEIHCRSANGYGHNISRRIEVVRKTLKCHRNTEANQRPRALMKIVSSSMIW